MMANLFVIVNSNRFCFGALVDHFRVSDPEVVNAEMDCLDTLPEATEYRSQVLDGLPTSRPSALRGSAPTPVPPPPKKSDCPKTTAPPEGTRLSYPPMRPKWDKVTDIYKAYKV